jgi:hypothetical protein
MRRSPSVKVVPPCCASDALRYVVSIPLSPETPTDFIPKVVIDRLDPLVNPGSIPSPHQHQIVGGNGFNASMTTGDVAGTASCTTCAFSKDFSNYWTANLYFKAKNGTYKRVKQLGAANQFSDNFSTQIDGGILVYYVSAQPGKVTAFKPVSLKIGCNMNVA